VWEWGGSDCRLYDSAPSIQEVYRATDRLEKDGGGSSKATDLAQCRAGEVIVVDVVYQ